WRKTVGIWRHARIGGVGERKDCICAFIIVKRQPQLLEVVLALSSPRCIAGLLHGRQQKRGQNADDGDDDQQFDQCKPSRAARSGCANRGCAPMYDVPWNGCARCARRDVRVQLTDGLGGGVSGGKEPSGCTSAAAVAMAQVTVSSGSSTDA